MDSLNFKDMAYENYSLRDFVFDDFFNRWAREDDLQANAYWETWLISHPEKEKMIREAKAMVLAMSTPGRQLSEDDQNMIWEAISRRRATEESSLRLNKRQERALNKPFWFNLYKVAAAVAILIAAGGMIFYLSNRYHTVNYATKYGEIQKIVLPDKSVVTLNANSEISFQLPWKDRGAREITLKGEAYFQIAGTPGKQKRKFVVHANRLNVEDLSTEFDVNSRRGQVRVVLREGSVRLLRSDISHAQGLVMQPGDMVEYDGNTSVFHKRRVDPVQFISWKNGIQIFNETPLSEVAQTLEDNYGWKFSFGNEKLKKLLFTGQFEANDVGDFLVILSKSFNLRISRNHDVIVIKKE